MTALHGPVYQKEALLWGEAETTSSKPLQTGARTNLRRLFSLLIVCLLPVVSRLHVLTHVLDVNPLLLHSGLGIDLVPGWIGAYPSIDPNVGFTSQALGRRSVLDVLGGRVPWWNPYEGVGTHLAGEMNAAALFPLTLLYYFRDGQLYFHISLQIIAAVFTFLLLRQLGCSLRAAVAGAVLFEFNGSFAWFAHSAVNPIPFLPMVLYGIECTRGAALARTRGGWVWIGSGFALSLYAGFPETAYLDGLLALCWFLVRACRIEPAARAAFVRGVVVSGLAGVLMAAPVLVAFFGFLLDAHVGGHRANGFVGLHIAPDRLLELLAPYVSGPIFAGSKPGDVEFWSNVGGYAGVALVALALAGTVGGTNRDIRVLLAAWVAVTIALCYGLPGSDRLVALVPGLGVAAFYRYLPPSWELALALLSAFAVDDLGRRGASGRGRALAGGAGLTAVMLSGCYLWFDGTGRFDGGAGASPWLPASLACAAALLAALMACALAPLRPPRRATWAGVLAAAEAIGCFSIPTFSGFARGHIETGGVRFLQERLGLQRFYTLGPIQPNYGAYFGIASINHNDLPLPDRWVRHVVRALDDNTPEILFTGVSRARPDGPTAAENLAKNLAHFEAVGVRYVVAPAGPNPFPPGAMPGADGRATPAAVYRDRLMTIYELPSPRPYFAAEGCRLQVESRERLTARCEAASVLSRLELFMPGWRVSVAGRRRPIGEGDGLFQEVELPAGVAEVEFSFRPPYMPLGYVAAGIGVVLLLAPLGRRRRPARGAA